jgi:hypothetical protein
MIVCPLSSDSNFPPNSFLISIAGFNIAVNVSALISATDILGKGVGNQLNGTSPHFSPGDLKTKKMI